MACPTCDHTMQGVSEWVWWCPRCGTIKDPSGITKPKIVERVANLRDFFDNDNDDPIVVMLNQMGISEAIGKHAERE